MQLSSILRDQYEPQKLRGKAAQTRTNYRSTLRMFALHLGREPLTGDLTDETVAAFLSWYEQREGVTSARSVNNRRDYLLCLWRWCNRKRLVDTYPEIDKLPVPAPDPRAWTIGELKKILDACDQQMQVGRIPGWLWWSAVHLFWWDTGERMGATLAARWSDYQPDTGMLFIPGESRKAHKPATYTLKAATKARLALMRLLDPDGEQIFHWPLNVATFYNRYEKLLKSAGLPCGRKDKAQKMRRSFASHLEAAGGNATEALQHTARNITQDSYLDCRIVKKPPPNLLLPEVG